jgi:ribonuclease P protein component
MGSWREWPRGVAAQCSSLDASRAGTGLPSDVVLPRRNRVRRSSDFQRVRRQGRRFTHQLVVMHACRSGLPDIRAGFVASKRVGSAVKRNRAKRLLREALRANLVQVKPGYDIVLAARPPVACAAIDEVRHAVEGLLRQGDLLKN